MAGDREPLPSIYVLVRDLLAIDPQQPSGYLTCRYCGVTMFGTVEELRAIRHRPRCAYRRAVRYLVEVERARGIEDGPGLRELGEAPTAATPADQQTEELFLFDL